MTDITKLADKWRKEAERDWAKVFNEWLTECAGELEATLPAWTKITEDESTWPDKDTPVLYVEFYSIYSKADPDLVSPEIGENLPWMHYTGTYYRYLTDYDYPPEESK